jgi:predicted branched-subunit amino acid permease
MNDSADIAHEHPASASRGRWLFRGIASAFSIPCLVLAGAFVGFAGLARDAGLTLPETLFMIAIVWALPAKVVLIGAILSGNSLPAAAFAVTLSSARLMPMVVSLVPEMRARGTRGWVLYILSHFVAVTSWVLAMQHFGRVPRPMRTAFYAGLGATLIVVNMVVVAIVYILAARLPGAVSAGLFFLMPLYFLTSMWGSARETATLVALGLGLLIGPFCHILVPGFDLLAAGLVAGLAAYAIHRLFLRTKTS